MWERGHTATAVWGVGPHRSMPRAPLTPPSVLSRSGRGGLRCGRMVRFIGGTGTARDTGRFAGPVQTARTAMQSRPPCPERMNSPLEKHEVRLRGLHPGLRRTPPAPGCPPGRLKPRSWTRQRPRVGAYRCSSGGFIRSGGLRHHTEAIVRTGPASRQYREASSRCCGDFSRSTCALHEIWESASSRPPRQPSPSLFWGRVGRWCRPGWGPPRAPPPTPAAAAACR